MKTSNLIYFLLVIITLSACSTYNYSSRVTNIPSGSSIVVTPTIVDIDVDYSKKIIVTSNKHNSEKSAVQEAYYRSIKENNIDILIDPIYEVETTSKILFLGGKSRATVTGFAGYYKNDRTLKEEKNDQFDISISELQKMTDIDEVKNEKEQTIIYGGLNQKNKQIIEAGQEYSIVEKYLIMKGRYNIPETNISEDVSNLSENKNLSNNDNLSKDIQSKKELRKARWKKILKVYLISCLITWIILIPILIVGG
ncbi:MAG: hypothetical protein JXL97_02740 [Bacteroidales bacterium]|nr:hypothetical protein [Bacteroidales bacterium]